MLYAIVAALVIILDQAVKFWVADAIEYMATKPFIPGILSLTNIHNDGAAFSILAGGEARIYFIILTAVFTVAVILALATRFISGRVARWSIVMVTAGGLANCIDRMIYGYVQDMFKVELFNFAVFNVADIFITVFAILFAIAMIFEKDPVVDDEDSILFEKDSEEEDKPSRRRKAERVEAREAKAAEKEARRRPKFMADSEEVSNRKERRARYEEELEQLKAKRPAREANPAAAAVAAQQRTPANKPVDPFAEWEKATARAAENQANSPAAKAAVVSKPVEAPKAVADPKPAAEPVQAAPVVEKKPAAKASDSFDLDDILSEFK